MFTPSPFLSGLLAASAVSIVTLAPQAVWAAPQDGVTCPAGFSAEISDNNRTLVCSRRTAPLERDSTCLGRGSINHLIRPNQPDICSDLRTQVNAGAPVPLLLPGDPQTGWQRQEFPTGKDRFVHTGGSEHALPQGAGFAFNPLADGSRGVSCRGPFSDGDRVANGRGIRCENPQRVAADCDFGWTLRVDDLNRDTDKCIGINGVGATKPRGLSHVQYQAQAGRWILDVRNGPDAWREFAYPHVN